MDPATILGVLLSFGLVLGAITMGSSLLVYLDLPSLLIVLGGTVGATLVNYPLRHVLEVLSISRKALTQARREPYELIDRFIDYSVAARREGLLALEPNLPLIDDLFLRKGLQLAVDGLEPETINDILEADIGALERRHEAGAEIFTAMGTYSPAMGLIGTVIGLVSMLKSMNDPTTIGPSMAVALLTTFYGATLANLVFLPLAGKLRARSRQEVQRREMIVEGVLSLAKGDNPRILEEKLNSHLPPVRRRARS